MIERGVVKTVKSAKKIVDRKDPIVWDILENVLKYYKHQIKLLNSSLVTKPYYSHDLISSALLSPIALGIFILSSIFCCLIISDDGIDCIVYLKGS